MLYFSIGLVFCCFGHENQTNKQKCIFTSFRGKRLLLRWYTNLDWYTYQSRWQNYNFVRKWKWSENSDFLIFKNVAAKHWEKNQFPGYLKRVKVKTPTFPFSSHLLILSNNGRKSWKLKILGHIWWRTVEKSQTNATSVTMNPYMQAPWRHIWNHTVEKSQTNVTNVIMHPLVQAIWGHIWKHTVEKRRTQPVWF